MIEIKVNGIVLPVPANFKMTQELVTTLFNKEDDVYDFHYPVDIPLTDQAMVALQYPNNLAKPDYKKQLSGELIEDGIFISQTQIKVLGVDLLAKTCRISVLGNYSSLALEFGDKKVNQLELGGLRSLYAPGVDGFEDINFTLGVIDSSFSGGDVNVTYVGGPTNAYMTKIANGEIYSDFLFPKAVDINPNVTGLMKETTISIINAWDPILDKYVDADLYNFLAMGNWQQLSGFHGIPSVPDIPDSKFINDQRHFWVPFFRLSYVLKQCFTEMGITVTGDVLLDSAFNDILLYNTEAINTGTGNGEYFEMDERLELTVSRSRHYVFPQRHVPNMKIIEFVLQAAKRYNLQYDWNPTTRTVRIIANRKLITDPVKVVDLTDMVNPNPKVSFDGTESFLNGYEFAFESDSADTAISDDVQDDLSTFTYRGAKNTEADLLDFTLPVVGEIAYVRNLNAYYKYDEGVWVFYSHNLARYKTSSQDDLQQVTTKFVSPPMKIFNVAMINMISGDYETFGKYNNTWEAVPFSNIGIGLDNYSYFDFDKDNGVYVPDVPISGSIMWKYSYRSQQRLPAAPLPHLVTYYGFREGMLPSFYNYVMCGTSPYDSKGTVLPGYSGCWSNPEGKGLYKDWWEEFTSLVIGSFTVDWELMLDAVTYNNMNFSNTLIIIDALRYLTKKAVINKPFPEKSTLTLVRV